MSDEILNRLKNVEIQLKNLKEQSLKISNKIKILEGEKEHLQTQYSLSRIRNAPDEASKWVGKQFEWSEKIQSLLNEKFKFSEFRHKQLAAINATLAKKDVLLLMPTGGGKSLVYQLPALVNKRITLVVSPLISLIEDQLISLKKLDIEAATLNGNSSKEEKKHVHNSMVDSESKLNLIYVTPEWVARSKVFMTYLQKCYDRGYLDRIVIDEVHCCSTWGHDFRPEYNHLGFFKSMFLGVPILGLTATATMNVLVDIQKMLSLEDSLIITAPFNRPNLYYKVVPKPMDKTDCLDYLYSLLSKKYRDQSGIIYAATTKDCEELASGLSQKGLKVKHYHAQVDPNDKKRIHERWLHNKYQAVVATIAFGMGIDKSDVRFVIHHSIPKSMEGLYQESGRAGRDGKKSDCILMYSLADFLRNVSMASSKTEEKNASSILEYCLNKNKCRRQLICEHFEDTWSPSHCDKMCDHCKRKKEVHYFNIKTTSKAIISLIEAASKKDIKLTLIKLVSAWFQTGAKELKIASLAKPSVTKEQAEDIIAFLILQGCIKIDKGYTMYTTLAYLQRGSKSYEDVDLMPYGVVLKGVPHVKVSEVVDVLSDEEPVNKKFKIVQ